MKTTNLRCLDGARKSRAVDPELVDVALAAALYVERLRDEDGRLSEVHERIRRKASEIIRGAAA